MVTQQAYVVMVTGAQRQVIANARISLLASLPKKRMLAAVST